jgi:hypothetical protein
MVKLRNEAASNFVSHVSEVTRRGRFVRWRTSDVIRLRQGYGMAGRVPGTNESLA